MRDRDTVVKGWTESYKYKTKIKITELWLRNGRRMLKRAPFTNNMFLDKNEGKNGYFSGGYINFLILYIKGQKLIKWKHI
jgi:hypothetical protein